MDQEEALEPVLAPDGLAIDIGGTKVEVARGPVRARRYWPGPAASVDDDLTVLGELVHEVVAGASIRSIGLASAPALDGAGAVTDWPSRPSWTGFPLRDHLGELLGAPIAALDDGAAAALAESHAAGGVDVLYVGVGTGIASGVVSGGALRTDGWGAGGALAHSSVLDDGPVCRCGRRGCLQTVASGTAVTAMAGRQHGSPVTGPMVAEGVRHGEPWAVNPLEDAAVALATIAARALAELPSCRLVLGGGLAAGVPELRARVGARWPRSGGQPPTIDTARHGHRSSLIGAILLTAPRRPGPG